MISYFNSGSQQNTRFVLDLVHVTDPGDNSVTSVVGDTVSLSCDSIVSVPAPQYTWDVCRVGGRGCTPVPHYTRDSNAWVDPQSGTVTLGLYSGA